MNTNLNHRIVVASLNHRYPSTPDLVKEYVSEFEHQDGLSCWRNSFKTLDELFVDFELYAASSDRPVMRGDVTLEDAIRVMASQTISTAKMVAVEGNDDPDQVEPAGVDLFEFIVEGEFVNNDSIMEEIARQLGVEL